jgi:hypothetical protein
MMEGSKFICASSGRIRCLPTEAERGFGAIIGDALIGDVIFVSTRRCDSPRGSLGSSFPEDEEWANLGVMIGGTGCPRLWRDFGEVIGDDILDSESSLVGDAALEDVLEDDWPLLGLTGDDERDVATHESDLSLLFGNRCVESKRNLSKDSASCRSNSASDDMALRLR